MAHETLPEEKHKCLGHYTYGEARTLSGRQIGFSCHPDDVQTIKTFVAGNVRDVDIPDTHRINVSHGSYGRYTRFDIHQHKYAGGGSGFIEVLEIKNPPEERCGIVIYEYTSETGDIFSEWETLENACSAFEKHWGGGPRVTAKEFLKLPGFKRRVACAVLTPWFYATGNQALVEDFAYPDGMEDDPYFVFGKTFWVNEITSQYGARIEAMMPKKCLGCRFVEKVIEPSRYNFSGNNEKRVIRERIVYWDDGTVSVFNVDVKQENLPQEMNERDVWILHAQKEFLRLLSGEITHFSIPFLDGMKFVGGLRPQPKSDRFARPGKYQLRISFKTRHKPVEGWTPDFVPTPEMPTIQAYAMKNFGRRDDAKAHMKPENIAKIEVLRYQAPLAEKWREKSKKWPGVFFSRSTTSKPPEITTT